MKHRMSPAILAAAAGFVLLWQAGGSGAQSILATGADAEVTEDGLHRVDPSLMEAAWVKPDLDLSRFARLFIVPTAVQFREVEEVTDAFSLTRSGNREFPVGRDKQDWLRGVWGRVFEEQFSQNRSFSRSEGVGTDVLVVQGILADVVSYIPPDSARSSYSWVRDPWVASVVLELRDGTTGELLARTNDRRTGEGLMDANTVWMLTEDLLVRWAQVLSERLDQLADLGGRPRVGGQAPG